MKKLFLLLTLPIALTGKAQAQKCREKDVLSNVAFAGLQRH